MDAEEAAAAADVDGEEQLWKCEICSREFRDDNSLANHFEACFQDHCPAETRIDEQAQGKERPTVRHELLLGSRLIPASAAAFLCRLLPPRSRMSLACTSRSARKCTDHKDLWDECVLSSWNALWSQSEDDPSNLRCLCNFQPPVGKTLQEAKKTAILVWIAANLDAVTLCIKRLNGTYEKLPVRGIRDASGIPVPVLAHMSVRHLKTLVRHPYARSGLAVNQIRLVQSDSKQLLHDTAPVGAYLWRELESNLPTDEETVWKQMMKLMEEGEEEGEEDGEDAWIVRHSYKVRIDMLIRMSTGGCSQSRNTEPLGPDAFHFMANARAP